MYLDAAATTKPNHRVIESIYESFMNWENPSALYSGAKSVRNKVDYARKTVADFIGAKPEEIIFTSGGSESNCLAISGFCSKKRDKRPVVITTQIEHKSVLECVKGIDTYYEFVKVDSNGKVDLDNLETCLQIVTRSTVPNAILVSIQYANNEIGTIQDVKKISEIVHKYGAIFHTDAVQAFPHIKIDVNELGIDMMSVSGHKFGCPKGIGFLYKRSSVNISPIIFGTQEFGLRGGTENVPYILGMEMAIKILDGMIRGNVFEKHISSYRNIIESELKNIGCKINGDSSSRLSNIISVTFPNKATGEGLIYILNASGHYISSGSACNSHSAKISHVLDAIGLTEDEALRTVRISLPYDLNSVTGKDIENFISEFKRALRVLEV